MHRPAVDLSSQGVLTNSLKTRVEPRFISDSQAFVGNQSESDLVGPPDGDCIGDWGGAVGILELVMDD